VIRKLSRSEVRELTASEVAPIPAEDRDEMAIPSYTHANPLIRWLMWRRYEAIDQLADPSAEMTALEFGCGIGLFLPTLAAVCRRVYAIDLFPQYAEALVERSGIDVRFVPDLDDVPDGSVDLIVAADVLEHVDDLPGWIARFRAKLRPGGRILVSGPTEGLVYRMGRWVAGFGGKGHYHHTNIDAIRGDFERAGFHAVSARGLPFPFPPYLFKVFRFE
jgi:2-polyprenyl-3-methyl-5-hydroxy-6-metoxy-1,4-benzoquinol methylase